MQKSVDMLVQILQFSYNLFFCTFDYQVQEGNEARQKFSNAKSISSAQFFGDENRASEAQISLEKYTVCAFSTIILYLLNQGDL